MRKQQEKTPPKNERQKSENREFPEKSKQELKAKSKREPR